MIEMIQNADLSILHAIQGAASPAFGHIHGRLYHARRIWRAMGDRRRNHDRPQQAPNVRHRHFRGNRARVRHWRHRTEKRHRAPEAFPGRPRAHNIAHIAT